MSFRPFDSSTVPLLADLRDFVVALQDGHGGLPTLDLFHAIAVCHAHRLLGGRSTPWPQAVSCVEHTRF